MGRPAPVEVPAHDGFGRRRAVQLRATAGQVVLIAPPGGAVLGPREFAELLGTLRLVAEVAQHQRQAGDGAAP